MNNFVIAQFFGVLGIIFSVTSMQMKTKKNIMILLICLNLSSALNFVFLDSLSGSFVCFFAVIETLINYMFDSKNKKIPIYIIGLYIIINIILGLWGFKRLKDVLPIIGATLYCLSISVKKESTLRKITFVYTTIWLIYDLSSKAYMFSICSMLTLVSIIIAIYRFDLKKKGKNE